MLCCLTIWRKGNGQPKIDQHKAFSWTCSTCPRQKWQLPKRHVVTTLLLVYNVRRSSSRAVLCPKYIPRSSFTELLPCRKKSPERKTAVADSIFRLHLAWKKSDVCYKLGFPNTIWKASSWWIAILVCWPKTKVEAKSIPVPRTDLIWQITVQKGTPSLSWFFFRMSMCGWLKSQMIHWDISLLPSDKIGSGFICFNLQHANATGWLANWHSVSFHFVSRQYVRSFECTRTSCVTQRNLNFSRFRCTWCFCARTSPTVLQFHCMLYCMQASPRQENPLDAECVDQLWPDIEFPSCVFALSSVDKVSFWFWQ